MTLLSFKSRRAVAVGEAMIEIAPIGDGLFKRGFAGDTFNTAWHMTQVLGAKASVGFFTRIGEDKMSAHFAAELAADGLDTSILARDAARIMGLYMIELEGVERSFHYWRSQSAARLLADDRERLAAALKPAGLLHLSGITLAILSPEARETLFDVLASARKDGAIVSFDPNIRPRLWGSQDEIMATVGRMLQLTDIALPSFDDEQSLWGDATPERTIERLHATGVREIVVKNGAGAAYAFSEGEMSRHDTPAVSAIVDTTGAGDAFNAGYLAARLTGELPADAMGLAQQLAALVLQNFGARAPKHGVVDLLG